MYYALIENGKLTIYRKRNRLISLFLNSIEYELTLASVNNNPVEFRVVMLRVLRQYGIIGSALPVIPIIETERVTEYAQIK